METPELKVAMVLAWEYFGLQTQSTQNEELEIQGGQDRGVRSMQAPGRAEDPEQKVRGAGGQKELYRIGAGTPGVRRVSAGLNR